MAESIKIKLDGSRYKLPTQKDISSAKQFILRRNEYARLLEGEIDDSLKDAAQAIVAICYKYDVDPNKFFISSEYNEKMMDEIAVVMDELEADVLDRIYSHSTSVAKDKKRANALAAWIAILGRGNRNLQDTLDDYLYKTMKDWEAAIAALRYADVDMGTATTKIKTNLHSIYTMPEVVAAFKYAEDFNATYIRSRGVTKGGVGLSNNGSTNVTNMGRITLQMAWMREQGIEFEENGAAGYYQLRGSSYPCSICDAEVGFHEGLEELYTKPYPHPHCCCYRVPIFPLETSTPVATQKAKEQNKVVRTPEDLPDNLFDIYTDSANGISFRIAKDMDTSKSDYQDLLKIATQFAKMGGSVAILKPYHVKSNEYQTVFSSLKDTKYWGKNPDLLVGTEFIEYESYKRPWKKEKVSNMLKHGLQQSSNIIIDNNDGASDYFIQKLIHARLKIGIPIDAVFLFENGNVRLLFENNL